MKVPEKKEVQSLYNTERTLALIDIPRRGKKNSKNSNGRYYFDDNIDRNDYVRNRYHSIFQRYV